MCGPNSEVMIVADAMRCSLRMLAKFGLTSATRGKVSALGTNEGVDPFAEMMVDLRG